MNYKMILAAFAVMACISGLQASKEIQKDAMCEITLLEETFVLNSKNQNNKQTQNGTVFPMDTLQEDIESFVKKQQMKLQFIDAQTRNDLCKTTSPAEVRDIFRRWVGNQLSIEQNSQKRPVLPSTNPNFKGPYGFGVFTKK